MEVRIKPSSRKGHKFKAIIDDGKKTVHFGASQYIDFTKNKDEERKEGHFKRHGHENWSKSNMASPAWM